MNAWSSSSWRCARIRSRVWTGSWRIRVCDSSRTAHHRLDERVRGVAVEGVEPVAEAAERDRVERQPGHVRRDVDLLARVEPRPLVHQLVGEVEHLGHVVAHRLQAERRHQDVVRAGPQRVVGVGGEQPGARGALAQVGQAAGDLLVEPRVVADLVDQLRARHEQPHPTRGDDLEDRPVLLGHPHEAAERVGRVDVEGVADQRQGPRPGDVLEGSGSVRVVVMVGSSGVRHRTGRCAARTIRPASATQPGKTSRSAGWNVVVTSIAAAMR